MPRRTRIDVGGGKNVESGYSAVKNKKSRKLKASGIFNIIPSRVVRGLLGEQ